MRLRFSPNQPQKLAVIRQYLVAVSASLPYAAAGTAIAWPSSTLPRIMNGEAPVFLNVFEISWMVSFLYLGSLVSAVPSGYLADRVGRKRTLLYSGVLPVISWIIILISSHSCSLYLARFLAGVQMGVSATIQPIYIGEISQADIRETLNTLSVITMNAGTFFMFMVGPFVSYYTLVWLSLSLPIMFVVTFQCAPESPYYIMMKGEVDEARDSLLWLRGDLNRIELEFELDQIEKVVEAQSLQQDTFTEVFCFKSSNKAILISLVFSAVKELSGFGVIQEYATITLPRRTFGVLTPNDCLIIIGAATVIFSLFAAFFTDTLGHKKLLIVSYLGCSFSMLIVSVWLYLDHKTEKDLFPSICFVPFLGYLTQAIAFNSSSSPSEGRVKVGQLPAHLKIKSSVLATIASSSTASILNWFYLPVANWEGMYVNYAVYAISCFLAVLFTIFYVPEVKESKSKEAQEIRNSSEHSKVSAPILNGTF